MNNTIVSSITAEISRLAFLASTGDVVETLTLHQRQDVELLPASTLSRPSTTNHRGWSPPSCSVKALPTSSISIGRQTSPPFSPPRLPRKRRRTTTLWMKSRPKPFALFSQIWKDPSPHDATMDKGKCGAASLHRWCWNLPGVYRKQASL
jgi:hypothetical protein